MTVEERALVAVEVSEQDQGYFAFEFTAEGDPKWIGLNKRNRREEALKLLDKWLKGIIQAFYVSDRVEEALEEDEVDA